MSSDVGQNMLYPPAKYQTEEAVKVGDYVHFRIWAELWLYKRKGRVMFVPGISPRNESLEYNSLKWVSVRYAGDTETAFVVHPVSGVTMGIHFVHRTDDLLKETHSDYKFSPRLGNDS